MDARPERLIAQAKERFALQDYYGCLHMLQEIIASGRGYADVHHLMGLAYHLTGLPEKALEAFDRALSLNPRYHEAHVHRGIVLNELGRADEAVRAFTSATETQGQSRDGIPSHHAAQLANKHAELGEAYVEVGALTEAIAQYRTAIKLGPTFHDLRYRLARLLLEAGRSLEAREELEILVAAQPNDVDLRSALGLACYVSGDLTTAESVWRGLAESHPDDTRVRAYLAMLQRAHDAT